MKKKINENQGITLVALVVTLITLLVLAGVSIGLVFNSDGLFSKANDTASKFNQSKEEELEYLQGTEEDLNKYNRMYEDGSEADTPDPTETVTPTPEPPEEEITVEQAKELVEREGLQDHLGKKVDYHPTGDPEGVYRIFYYDNEANSEDPSKGYFGDPLGTLYLKRDFVGEATALKSYTKHTPLDNGEVMKKMNPKWAASTNASEIDLQNEHCVAWLCDPEVWQTKYKIEGVASYVIGSPSVEMYMKAFNVYKDNNANSTTLINKIGNFAGYSVGAQNLYSNSGNYTNYNTIETGPHNIFMTAGENSWWLASPASYCDSCSLIVFGKRENVYYNHYVTAAGICPIVSIN